MNADRRALFLHGGPGFSAALERSRYGNTLPVHWWDQPRIPSDLPRPFESLVRAAQQQAERLAMKQDGPIALLASSFGARLALELLHRVPDALGTITISGGVLDIRRAFVRFGRRLAAKQDRELERLADAAERSDSTEPLWALIGGITGTPDFLDEYWSPSATGPREALRALAAAGPLLDFETFKAVVNDVVATPVTPTAGQGRHRIRVLIGRSDPYTDAEDEALWRRHFRNAMVEYVDAGHFPHLERPPREWMPE